MIRGATKGSYFGPMVFGSKFMEHTLQVPTKVNVYSSTRQEMIDDR